MKNPLVLEIKGNSLDDGPGIRSVVFLKGCPLDCLWCHNPESKHTGPEIGFDASQCIGCDTCIGRCPEGALDRGNRFFVDRDRCGLCFDCTDECPSGALSRVGKPMTIDAIMAAVLKDKPFYDTSGGGVTLSGGEPTLFMDYTEALLTALKEAGVHTLVETCGYFDAERFESRLLPKIDMLYYDIKLIDPEDHQRFCGKSNQRILSNFKRLQAKAGGGGIPVTPRTPLIPGVTDTEANLRGIARFLRQCGVQKSELLPYHPLWQAKNDKIGILAADPAIHDPDRFLPVEKIAACKAWYAEEGIAI